jgi:hypothetical protein
VLTLINIKAIAIASIGALLLLSCNTQTNIEESNQGKLIAKINDSKLYNSDIEELMPKEISGKDSAEFITSYINKWADKEVFYQQATSYLTDEDQDVTQELEAYKKELVSFKFQLKLINEKLDTNVSNAQIEDYYNKNSQNFLLKNNIVKVLYIKAPKSIPALDKLKKLCYSSNPKDAEALNNLCVQYANNYYMNDNTWLMFDDLKKEIPQLKDVPDYTVQNGKIYEFTDVASFYFLKIIEIKTKNNISPINFEKTNIKNRLINQRKQLLINTIKKDFFDKAITNKELEIYN